MKAIAALAEKIDSSLAPRSRCSASAAQTNPIDENIFYPDLNSTAGLIKLPTKNLLLE